MKYPAQRPLLRSASSLRWMALFVAIPFSAACGDEIIEHGLEEPLRFSPGELDLGEVSLGDRVQGSMRVRHDGAIAIQATVRVPAESGFEVLPRELRLSPGATQELDVTFVPSHEGLHTARVKFLDDGGTRRGSALLSAVGSTCYLTSSSARIDFGEVAPNMEHVVSLTVTNPCSASKNLEFFPGSNFRACEATSDPSSFCLTTAASGASPTWPISLSGGGSSIAFEVRFQSPIFAVRHDGRMVLRSCPSAECELGTTATARTTE